MYARRLPIMLIAFSSAILLALPLSVLAGGNGVDRGCIVEAGAELASDHPGTDVGVLTIQVIEQDPAATNVTVTVTCSGETTDAIQVRLLPGREAVIELLLIHQARVGAQLSVASLASEGGEPEWLTIDPQAVQAADAPVRLVLRSGSELVPGSTHQALVRFAVEDNELVELAVSLEIADEGPLFRDRFEVDPVLGQFSYRAPRPRHTRDHPEPADRSFPAGTGE